MKDITKNHNKLINARFIIRGVLAMVGDCRILLTNLIFGNSGVNSPNLATFYIGQDMLDT